MTCVTSLRRGQRWRMAVHTLRSCATPKTPYYGDTPLIAAMRCLVGNAIGDEVQANVAWLY